MSYQRQPWPILPKTLPLKTQTIKI